MDEILRRQLGTKGYYFVEIDNVLDIADSCGKRPAKSVWVLGRICPGKVFSMNVCHLWSGDARTKRVTQSRIHLSTVYFVYKHWRFSRNLSPYPVSCGLSLKSPNLANFFSDRRTSPAKVLNSCFKHLSFLRRYFDLNSFTAKSTIVPNAFRLKNTGMVFHKGRWHRPKIAPIDGVICDWTAVVHDVLKTTNCCRAVPFSTDFCMWFRNYDWLQTMSVHRYLQILVKIYRANLLRFGYFLKCTLIYWVMYSHLFSLARRTALPAGLHYMSM